jgi:hypothetical protein
MFKKLGKRAKALGCVVADKSKAVKGVVVAGATVVMTTVSQAAVEYDSTTGALTGSFDLAGYHSALAIIIPASVTIVVGGVILRAIKKI